jgi:hypothetical protein
MKEAILFKRCLGLNDIHSFATQQNNPKPDDPNAGNTELIDCLNLTTTRDGALESLPALVTAFTHSAPITNISADKRFMFQDSIDTLEWTGTDIYNRFPICDGPIAHTPVDVRVCTPSAVYKSRNNVLTMEQALVGTNPNPITSIPFYQMPLYDQAFVYNAKCYVVNAADKRFLQYSEDYHYDLWALGDRFFSFKDEILQSGAVFSEKPNQTGAICLVHAYGVSILDGSNPTDFTTKYYDCTVIDGSLFSGFISKLYGYGHVFLCDDGVYMIDADGTMVDLTIGLTSYLKSLNTVIHSATVHDGKYIACGDLCSIEYDFYTKTILKHSCMGVSTTVWRDQPWFASGEFVKTYGIDDSLLLDASMQLPYSNLGNDGAKSIYDMYFTGTINGTLSIAAYCNEEKTWEKTIDGIGTVSNYRIKTPSCVLGNHVSFKLSSTNKFRLEKLTASYNPSQRSR